MGINIGKVDDIASKITLLIAFLIPLSGILVTQLTLLLLLLVVFQSIKKGKFPKFYAKKPILLMLFIYALTFISFFYTSHPDRVLFDVEVKILFVVFPFLLSVVKFDMQKVLDSYISGVFTSGAICILSALYMYYVSNSTEVFFYQQLSILHHPSYFAMYMNFALVILLIRLGKKGVTIIRVFKIITLCVLTFMLGSKTGIITLLLTVIGLLAYQVVFLKNRIIPVAILVVCLVLSVFFVKTDVFQKRLMSLITFVQGDDVIEAENSNSMRVSAWVGSLESFKLNPVIGVSIGNVKDALNEQYKIQGSKKALKRSLNSHNQYLHYLVAYGVVGFALFLLHFVFSLQHSIHSKNYYFLLFTVLFMINCVTESMLERRSGVMFYMFFLSLFAHSSSNKLFNKKTSD